FFFQAEDGIRDLIVTGVQTCALPICRIAKHCEADSCERLSSRFYRIPANALGPRVHSDRGPAMHCINDSELPADAELVDNRPVPPRLFTLQIFQESPPLSDQHQQPPARVVVLRVGLEMLGQSVDALGEERDLDLGRPGVALVRLELLDQALLAVDS